MDRRNLLARAGVVGLSVVLIGGLVRLGQVSLTGSYPAFSSLRSDGSGTKLLWDGLAQTGKIKESRSYRPLEETRFARCSVLYLGLRPGDLLLADEDFLQTAEQTAKAGNRLIIGITDDLLPTGGKDKKEPLIKKRWNFQLIQSKENKNNEVSVDARPPWQALFAGKSSGAFERAFGSGTVVLLPHSSRLSNAVLANDTTARELVPALIGNNETVVFDEAHLGVVESGSIAGLARKYRLHGLLVGLLILAAAFLWNRSVVFPPIPADDENNAGIITGNDTRSTLVNLLSSHVSPDELLKICISEWNRMHPDKHIGENDNTALKNPVLIYRTIQENLQSQNKWKI